ncbi:MAG: aminopeptidase P family protein, partial [Pseudomonadota bacterium]
MAHPIKLDHYARGRKINPHAGDVLGDGTPNNHDRIEIGPTKLAFSEWEQAGLKVPNLARMREFRWRRLCDQIITHELAGLLLFDPLNIRYATDSTNMQLWNMHNPFRAVLICADGYMVIWDYKNAPFLSSHNPLVREVRSGASMFYFVAGDLGEKVAQNFAGEVHELIREHAGAHRRLGVDKIMIHGLR